MKRIISTFLAVLGSGGAAGADIHALSWLSGCWAATDLDPGSIEHWSMPAGGTMFGFNRTISGNVTVAFEYLRIVTLEDGTLVLIAAPSGQAATEFTLISLTASEAVFENSRHDFPQRIIYRRDGDNFLVGRIEGVIDGEASSTEFPFERAACNP